MHKDIADKRPNFEITSFQKEDIPGIIKKHAELYSAEYGFDATFEDYVAAAVDKFCQTYDPKKENIWVVKVNGALAGCIAIVKAAEKTAQLRWFLVDRNFRGQGLGKKLMRAAINFCKDNEYELIYLWTVDKLIPARLLYQSFGFRLTETIEHDLWGQHLVEERWDLACL